MRPSLTLCERTGPGGAATFHSSETKNTIKIPGSAKVTDNARPWPNVGETALSRGENGLGKLMSTKASRGTHFYGLHEGETTPVGEET